MIDAWVDYMRHQGEQHDLATVDGRRRAWIELDLAVRSLPDNQETALKLCRTADLIFKLPSNSREPQTVSGVFAERTEAIIGKLPWGSSSEPSLHKPGIDRVARTGIQTDLKWQTTVAA